VAEEPTKKHEEAEYGHAELTLPPIIGISIRPKPAECGHGGERDHHNGHDGHDRRGHGEPALMELGPVTLTGKHIRLEPLRRDYAASLLAVAEAPEIWTWMSALPVTPAAMDAWIAEALGAQESGLEYPFVVVLLSSDRVVGSTRYMDVQAASKGAEIGWTWYAPDTWGTVVNPEAKYLLLRHAFEDWGAIRVQLKTDLKNLRSQAAIKKLGARQEGILRSHRFRRDGTIRDSVLFSIIREEWPGVKAELEQRLAQGGE
jgi:RimJ/RimL family protein N-acetyltransferase